MSGFETKEAIRAAARERVGSMTAADRAAASSAVVERITGSGWWQGASCVLIFAGDDTEPNIDRLIEIGERQGKRMSCPAIDWTSKSMHPKRVRSTSDLTMGRHGIRVPGESCEPIDPDRVELVLVPGVAFDGHGGRLGRGGGFYDRFLAAWRARPAAEGGGRLAVGVGFAAQVVGRVPTEGHDQRLDGLVTDAGDGPAGEPASTEERR